MMITRRIEIDAGHRVPDHASKCRNPHGHRYEVEVDVDGKVRLEPGHPENGMVIDFAVVKQAMLDAIDAPWDHAFLVHEDDEMLREFLVGMGWKVDVLRVVPTVENLVRIAALRLMAVLKPLGVDVVAVRMWETRSCRAEWRA